MINSLYERLRTTSSSSNQLNKVFISLENSLTRDQIESVCQYIRLTERNDALRQGELEWCDSIDRKLEFLHGNGQFVRIWSKRRAVYYRRKGTTKSNTLLIGFTGRAGRMMLPAWVFLNELPDSVTDVVIFRALPNKEGISTSFSQSLSYYVNSASVLLHSLQPTRVVSMGVSGGSLPSLLAGLYLKIQHIVVVGFIKMQDKKYETEFRIRKSVESRRIDYVYGTHDGQASRNRWNFKFRFPQTKFHRFKGFEHNVFNELLLKGKLSAFLKEILDSA